MQTPRDSGLGHAVERALALCRGRRNAAAQCRRSTDTRPRGAHVRDVAARRDTHVVTVAPFRGEVAVVAPAAAAAAPRPDGGSGRLSLGDQLCGLRQGREEREEDERRGASAARGGGDHAGERGPDTRVAAAVRREDGGAGRAPDVPRDGDAARHHRRPRSRRSAEARATPVRVRARERTNASEERGGRGVSSGLPCSPRSPRERCAGGRSQHESGVDIGQRQARGERMERRESGQKFRCVVFMSSSLVVSLFRRDFKRYLRASSSECLKERI